MEWLAHMVAIVVVPLFFVGMAGSVVVIVVSFAEDMRELFGEDE